MFRTDSLQPQHKAILLIAIEWRNQRVHSLSDDKVEKQTIRIVRDNSEWFHSNYSGLNVDNFLSHFNIKEAPTFKDAASVIRLTHDAVAQYDADLLKNVKIENYVKELLLIILETDKSNVLRSIQKTWNHPDKKRIKVIRLLRMIGVNETDVICGREVPEEFVEDLVGLESSKVLGFLQG